MALRPLLALGSDLVLNVKVPVCESIGVDQKIPFALEGRLLFGGTERDRFGPLSGGVDIEFKGRAGFEAEPVANCLRNDNPAVVVDGYFHCGGTLPGTFSDWQLRMENGRPSFQQAFPSSFVDDWTSDESN